MFALLTDRQWLWLAAGFYLAVFLTGTLALRRGRPHSSVFNYLLMVAGYLCQLTGLYLRGRAVGGCPLGNPFEIFQFTTWSATTLYLVIGVTFRSSMLGFFTACLAAVLSLVSLSIPAWDATRRAGLFGTNPWIEFHAALALFSYGVFALLALTSLMFLLRNYSLKSKHVSGWFSFLPSILDLDHIGVRLLAAGVALLTVSLAVGARWWLPNPASVDGVKIICTIAVWVAYGLVLGLRLGRKVLAGRFALICLALFAAALLSLWAVNDSRHGEETGKIAQATR
ncbi:MAG TPA: cytochrome c biogenesis protein CcsA [Opitutaceae bacterium]|nr:cytochrome c biogenesis protein CcsA [Opitutaceae bacterium]